LAVKLEAKRDDWKVVAADARESGNWTAEDEAEIGAAVASDLERGDPVIVEAWAYWLARQAENVRRLQAMAAQAESRIRACIAADRKEAA